MNKIIAAAALTLTLSTFSGAQTATTTKTICKGTPIPEGYTTISETQSGDCPNGAWIIKQRGVVKPRLEQSVDRSPGMAEGTSTGVRRTAEPLSPTEALEFAQKAFSLLSRGQLAVEEMIDWDNLKLEGKDFGAVLKQLAASTGKDPATVRKEIIANFGSYYRGSGEGPFSNWKVDSRDAETVTIAATSAKGEVVLFTVSLKGGRQVISGLNSRK